MTERSKSIARQWNREIEDAARRAEVHARERRRWRSVAWAALWVLWLALLVALVVRVNPLG
jgi:hypothetical protein